MWVGRQRGFCSADLKNRPPESHFFWRVSDTFSPTGRKQCGLRRQIQGIASGEGMKKATAFPGTPGGTVFEGNAEARTTRTVVTKRARSETQRSAAEWEASGHQRGKAPSFNNHWRGKTPSFDNRAESKLRAGPKNAAPPKLHTFSDQGHYGNHSTTRNNPLGSKKKELRGCIRSLRVL